MAITFIAGILTTELGIGATAATILAGGLELVAVGGLSYVTQSLLTKKPDAGAAYSTLQTGGVTPQSFLFGETATAGHLVYFNDWGKDDGTPNAYHTRVILLSDLPIAALTGLTAYGKNCTYGSGTPDPDHGYAIPEFDADGQHYLWVKFYDGTQTSADPWMVAQFGPDPNRPYESTRVGYGRAYVIVTMRFNQKLFTGDPGFKFAVRGAKWYDPTKDSTAGGSGSHRWDDQSTWEYSNNPQLIRYNIRRGVYYGSQWLFGPQGMSAARLPYANWAAAIADCETLVANQAGGTEPRYRCGGEVTLDTQPADLDESLMRACNARSTEVGGVYKTTTGVIGSAVASYTDDDFIVTQQKTFDQYPGLSGTVNGITGHFPDPTQGWASTDAPGLFDSDLEAQDGNRQQLADISYDCVPFAEQVQRNMKAALAEERRWRTHVCVLPHTAWLLEPGDAISWTSDSNGYDNKLFRIESLIILANRDVQITIREADPSDYDWDPSADFTPIPAGNLGDRTLPSQVIIGWEAEGIAINGDDGRAKPGIELEWSTTDIDDVDGILFQVRLKSDSTLILSGETTHSVELFQTGNVIISENLSSDTAYQVRGKYRPISTRDTDWSDWLDVTTPLVQFVAPDYGDFTIDITKLTQPVQDLLGKVPQVEASTRSLLQTVEQNAQSIISLATAFQDQSVKIGSALVYANQELTKTITGGLKAEAQARLDLAALVEGIINGTTDTVLTARVTQLETATADLGTIRAQAAMALVLDAQLNTPDTGIAAQVSQTAQALAALEDTTTATSNQTTAVARFQGLQMDKLGETLLQILTTLQDQSKRMIGALAFVSSTFTATVTDGQSAYAKALAEVTAMMQDADASLSASIQSTDQASVTRDQALTDSLNTAFSYFGAGIDGSHTVAAKLATEETTRANADTALADRATALEATINTPGTGLSAVVGSHSTAIADLSANKAEASTVTTLSSRVDDHTTSIANLLDSVDGIQASWAVQIDSGGRVTGLVRLDGGASSSNFVVVASNAYFYDVNGAQPMFSLSGGVARFAIPLAAGTVNAANIIADNLIVKNHIQGGQITDFQGLSGPTAGISTSEVNPFGSGANIVISNADADTKVFVQFSGSFSRAGGTSPTCTFRIYRKSISGSDVLLGETPVGGSGIPEKAAFSVSAIDPTPLSNSDARYYCTAYLTGTTSAASYNNATFIAFAGHR